MTKLIQKNIELPACRPLIEAAGSDISHWFDEFTWEPKMAVDAQTNMLWYFCP